MISKENKNFDESFVDFMNKKCNMISYNFLLGEKKERIKKVVECLNLFFSFNYNMTLDNWKHFIEAEIPINKIKNKKCYKDYVLSLYEIKEYYVFKSQSNRGITYEKCVINIDNIVDKYKLHDYK